jgi:hypothetical protein
MVASGATVKAVQRQLGHASASMTLDTYAKLFPEELGAVADRLDELHKRAACLVGRLWAKRASSETSSQVRGPKTAPDLG